MRWLAPPKCMRPNGVAMTSRTRPYLEETYGPHIINRTRTNPMSVVPHSRRPAADTDSFLQTTVVGSYPQPEWLIDKTILRGQYVPRVPMDKLWRVPVELRAEAIRDATLLAIRDMEAAGIEVITDGEIS